MNRTTINGVVYESQYSMSIINNKVVCDGAYYINGKLYGEDSNTKDNSDLISKSLDISNIKSLYNGFFTIELQVDPSIEKEELIITATEKVHTKITKTFNSSNLFLACDDGFHGEVKILLKSKNLKTILNSGIGSISGSLNVEELKINNEGVGSIKVTGFTNSLNLQNSGVGSLNALELFAKTVSFSNSGVGSLKFTSKILKNGSLSGVGSVKYYADEESKVNKSGLGSVKYLGLRKFPDNNDNNQVDKKPNASSTSDFVQKSPSQNSNNNVSFADIEKSVQVNKSIPPKEGMADLMNSISKKIKKLL